jgi:hypothetical protein
MTGRDPLSNVIDDGMIVNPPRFAELGGLDAASKTFKNKMQIKKPAATIRKVPVS